MNFDDHSGLTDDQYRTEMARLALAGDCFPEVLDSYELYRQAGETKRMSAVAALADWDLIAS